ncbi:MAG: hypothetical protein AAF676_11655 [Pseudomonadota bacterium]
MIARYAFAALALGLTAAPASAVVLGQAALRIDGTVTLTAAPFGGAVVSSLAPANGAPHPFGGVGYGFVVEMTGALSARSTLPPSTAAVYSASGAATLGSQVLDQFGPSDLGVLRLDQALAEPPFPMVLGALATLPESAIAAHSDPSGDVDGFFSYAAVAAAGEVQAAFNGFLGFDDPILGIDAAASLAGAIDAAFGGLVNALLSDLFFRAFEEPPAATEPFAVRVDVTATAIPGPVAAPLLVSALVLAAFVSRGRRRLRAG